MNKIASICFAFMVFASASYAQDNLTATDLIHKGTQLHDKGDYYNALTYYRQALAKDPNSAEANYETANTYVSLAKYKEAIEYADKVIAAKGNFVDHAYILKGTALDMLKEPYQALEVYLEALKTYPDNYLLRYNTALVYLNQKKYTDAAFHAAKGVMANPKHASSHFALGCAMYYQGRRVQSMMCLYYFLLLENNSKRSPTALQLLQNQMAQGVSQKGDSINVQVGHTNDNDEFSSIEMMLSLLQATKYTDKQKGKTETDHFINTTSTFFDILVEQKEKATTKSIWWKVYAPFFEGLKKQGYVQAASYYVLASAGDTQVSSWLNTNKSKTDNMLKWIAQQK